MRYYTVWIINQFILPTGREELLTEHALVWNKRKITQMPAVLAKRYIQVSVVILLFVIHCHVI
jgi:hypothetical protein